MSAKAEKPDPEKSSPRRCEGFGCCSTQGVRYDRVTHKYLCNDCWAKVDPARYGVEGR